MWLKMGKKIMNFIVLCLYHTHTSSCNIHMHVYVCINSPTKACIITVAHLHTNVYKFPHTLVPMYITHKLRSILYIISVHSHNTQTWLSHTNTHLCTFLGTHILRYTWLKLFKHSLIKTRVYKHMHIKIYREGKLSSIHGYVIVHILRSWKHYEVNNNKS